MTEWYFYQEHGKTVGPVSVDDVKGLIREGRLRMFDLLYKDGDALWKMALEHPALVKDFKSTTASTLKEKPWVCLQRKTPDSLDFVTTGPFTSDEVTSNLLAGRVSYADYAWKDGFTEWKRIGALEEFNRRARNRALPHTPPESRQELLSAVEELSRPDLLAPEEPPSEAGTFDLTLSRLDEADFFGNDEPTKIRAPLPLPVTKTEVEKPAEVVAKAPAPSELGPPPLPAQDAEGEVSSSAKTRRSALDWGLVGVLVLLLVAAVVVISRFSTPRTAPAVAEFNRITDPPAVTVPAEVVVTPPPPAPAPVPEAVPTVAAPSVAASEEGSGADTAEEAPAAPKPAAKPPTELYLAVQGQGTNNARFEVRSNGSADFPVQLQIVGLPGQVTEGGGFYRLLNLNSTGDVRLPLDLGSLKMPLGKFYLKAETGRLKKETKLMLGKEDANFKATLAKQRKLWSAALWKERLNIFKFSQVLEKQLIQASVPTKHLQSRGLEPLLNLKRANGGNYLLFEDWWELHSIATEAKNGVSPALIARATREREHLAAFSVWK